MALLEILTVPDPRLKQVSEEVATFDNELQAFIDDL
ncbi:MAG: peptide deformylase, partial [Gammaproteobacteria bacterium]